LYDVIRVIAAAPPHRIFYAVSIVIGPKFGPIKTES